MTLTTARLAALTLLLVVSTALAQTNSYDLSWFTGDGGGATFSGGGSYTLGGTIGQPDAGTLSDGSYTLAGGFWAGVCLLQADVNGDGTVTVWDVQAVAARWRTSPAGFPFDQDGDNDVDIQDIMLVSTHFGEGC